MDVSRVQKEVPQMLLENFPTLCIHDFATNISLRKDYDLCYTNYSYAYIIYLLATKAMFVKKDFEYPTQ